MVHLAVISLLQPLPCILFAVPLHFSSRSPFSPFPLFSVPPYSSIGLISPPSSFVSLTSFPTIRLLVLPTLLHPRSAWSPIACFSVTSRAPLLPPLAALPQSQPPSLHSSSSSSNSTRFSLAPLRAALPAALHSLAGGSSRRAPLMPPPTGWLVAWQAQGSAHGQGAGCSGGAGSRGGAGSSGGCPVGGLARQQGRRRTAARRPSCLALAGWVGCAAGRCGAFHL